MHPFRRFPRALMALVTAAAMMISGTATPAIAATGPADSRSSEFVHQSHEMVNKGIVLSLVGALNRGHIDYINRVVRRDLIQHDPEIANGRDAFRRYYQNLRVRYPNFLFKVARVIAQRDKVVVHGNFVPNVGDLGIAKTSVYRLSHGTIVEYWEVDQAVPPPSSVGRDMFSTVSSPAVSRPLPLSTAAASARAIQGMFAEAINEPDDDRRTTALRHYIGDNPYYQHFPGVPDGIGGVQQFLRDAWAVHPDYRADVQFVVAEGDLAVVMVHLYKLFDIENGVATDLVRVRDGKLLEHWSVTQAIPNTSANGNTMY